MIKRSVRQKNVQTKQSERKCQQNTIEPFLCWPLTAEHGVDFN